MQGRLQDAELEGKREHAQTVDTLLREAQERRFRRETVFVFGGVLARPDVFSRRLTLTAAFLEDDARFEIALRDGARRLLQLPLKRPDEPPRLFVFRRVATEEQRGARRHHHLDVLEVQDDRPGPDPHPGGVRGGEVRVQDHEVPERDAELALHLGLGRLQRARAALGVHQKPPPR